MTSIDIDIQIYCGGCGAGLCHQTHDSSSRHRGREPSFTVEPCEACVNAARNEGYDERASEEE